MRKIREVLRLSAAGRSQRLIAQSVGIGQSTVGDYLSRARLSGVAWPTELDDAALEQALYPSRPSVPTESCPVPDWPTVHRELKRKGVTLFLLWEEYKAAHPQGFHYSWFCQQYRRFAGRVDLVLVLLPLLNGRAFKKLPGCRQSLFETLERPALSPLPDMPYVFATRRKARVSIDYHVEVERRYYSVPYQLVKCEVEARISEHTVEVFHRNRRVASHRLAARSGHYTTLTEHMPRPHREYAEWTPQCLVHWADESGPATAELICKILASRRHAQQGFRSCLGILRLSKTHGAERLEAACQRALHIGAASYKSVESILKHKLDQKPLPAKTPEPLAIVHDNLRGPDYYH